MQSALGNTRTMLIGTRLVEAELLSAVDLSHALFIQQRKGERLLRVLRGLSLVSDEDVFRYMARHGFPTINPADYQIPRLTLQLTPSALAQRIELMPIDKLGNLLSVAMVCPFDLQAIEVAEHLTGLRVRPFLCRPKEFDLAIERHYGTNHLMHVGFGRGRQRVMNRWHGQPVSGTACTESA